MLDAVLPPSCGACGVSLAGVSRHPDLVPLCDPCRDSLEAASEGCAGCGFPVTGPGDACPSCRASSPPLGSLVAVVAYGGTGRDLVLRLKHGRRPDLAAPLGTWMALVAHRRGLVLPDTVVVPVGPWPAHVVQRGYSAPVLLAREVARRTGSRWIPDLLVRVRPPGDPQGDRRSREDAVRSAWRLRGPDRVADRSVLLVDDVVTTGATAREVSRLLAQAGARTVDVLALARVD